MEAVWVEGDLMIIGCHFCVLCLALVCDWAANPFNYISTRLINVAAYALVNEEKAWGISSPWSWCAAWQPGGVKGTIDKDLFDCDITFQPWLHLLLNETLFAVLFFHSFNFLSVADWVLWISLLSSLTLSFADFMNHFKNKHQTERNLADPLERCVILSTAPPSAMTIKHEKSNNRNALTSRSINFAVQWLDDVFAGFSACGSQTGAAVLFMTIFRRGRRMARGKLLNI